jgi:exopolyphosphatase / guanosine-5'-triphosphate,3'-diphosphate pyrophosphatase
VNAIQFFIEECEQYNVIEINCFATSAIRDASNKNELVSRLLNIDSRISIDVIDGDQEAYLISKGVEVLVPDLSNYLIIDIGGGSIEFIIVSHGALVWKQSYDIGIARLLSKFPHNDPMSSFEANILTDYLDSILDELYKACTIHRVDNIIGASGSFETYFDLLKILNNKPFEVTTSINLQGLLHSLVFMTQKELFSNDDIPDFRVKLLPYASLLVNHLISKLNIKKVMYSDFSMKEGAYSLSIS